MADNQEQSRAEQFRPWFSAALKLLVFLAFLFVLYEMTVGLGNRQLDSNRMWVIIAGMVGLLLLLAVDRLVELTVGPQGMKATLTELKAQALQEVSGLENREAVVEARSEILQARSPVEVKEAVKSAIEQNAGTIIERIEQAIRQQRKLYVRYRADPQAAEEVFLVAPLDVKPGRTPNTRATDYLWAHSYKLGHVISPRLGQILGVEISEESFDPAEFMKEWRNREPQWNVPRDW